MSLQSSGSLSPLSCCVATSPRPTFLERNVPSQSRTQARVNIHLRGCRRLGFRILLRFEYRILVPRHRQSSNMPHRATEFQLDFLHGRSFLKTNPRPATVFCPHLLHSCSCIRYRRLNNYQYAYQVLLRFNVIDIPPPIQILLF